MPKDPIPITIRDVTYDSKAEAARQIGVTREALRIAEKQNRLDKLGLNPQGRKKRKCRKKRK
jgi:hypothetical protein